MNEHATFTSGVLNSLKNGEQVAFENGVDLNITKVSFSTGGLLFQHTIPAAVVGMQPCSLLDTHVKDILAAWEGAKQAAYG